MGGTGVGFCLIAVLVYFILFYFYICLALILQCLHGFIRAPEVFKKEIVTEEERNVGKAKLEFFAVEEGMHTEDGLTRLPGWGMARCGWGRFRVVGSGQNLDPCFAEHCSSIGNAHDQIKCYNLGNSNHLWKFSLCFSLRTHKEKSKILDSEIMIITPQWTVFF